MVDEVRILGIKKSKKMFTVMTSLKDYLFDEDTIVKYMILKDKVFSKNDFEEIVQTSQINYSVNKALRYLSYGMRTTHEIRLYLKEEEQIEAAIQNLEKLGYLNDEAFATQYLDYVIRNKKGPVFLQSNLKEKGVDERIVSDMVKNYPEEAIQESLHFIANKFVNSHHDKPPKTMKRQLAQKLIRDGFATERVFSFVKGLEIEDKSEESLKKDVDRLYQKFSTKGIESSVKKQKVFQSLLQKGYEYSTIRKMLE